MKIVDVSFSYSKAMKLKDEIFLFKLMQKDKGGMKWYNFINVRTMVYKNNNNGDNISFLKTIRHGHIFC